MICWRSTPVALRRPAQSFDPGRGAAFPTYAFFFIKGALRRSLAGDDALAFAGELPGDNEEDAPTEDETAGSAKLARLIWHVGRMGGPARVGEAVYAAVQHLPSAELEELVAAFDAAFSDEEREASRALGTVRLWLDVAHTRALHRAGALVRASDLAQMLAAKHRGASNRELAGAFGISAPTVAAWLRRCAQEGVEAGDLSVEALGAVGRIMSPKRGPWAGRRL